MSTPYEEGPFRQASDMEIPLATVSDLALALSFVADTLDGNEASVVQRLAMLIHESAEAAEKLRCNLFRLTHPRRDHFEKEGWPGDEPARMTGGARNG